MSEINIARLVANMREKTSVYTPLVEALVNGLQAIGDNGIVPGIINVKVLRSKQVSLPIENGALPDIVGFEISDNGIGFNDENKKSFDTLFSEKKMSYGGKGFGRFTYLKYFKYVKIESTYQKDESYHKRTFSIGRKNEIIENESNTPLHGVNKTGTILYLNSLLNGAFEKRLDTIAKKILEKILVFFVELDKKCPQIYIEDDTDKICLNELLDEGRGEVLKFKTGTFVVGSVAKPETFNYQIFKIFYPENQKSKVSLVANNREVVELPMHKYIPEFVENFYDKVMSGEKEITKDYTIKTFITGKYLDEHVSPERSCFVFPSSDLLNGDIVEITEDVIAKQAAEQTKLAFPAEISTRRRKKVEKINSYVNANAPWYKSYVEAVNLDNVPFQLNDGMIDAALAEAKFKKEREIKREAKDLLSGNYKDVKSKIVQVVDSITDIGKSDLSHYVATRKVILDFFKKSLESLDDGKYERENVLHDIIFPRKNDSMTIDYEEHNLWIIDERLNFTRYLRSDLPLSDINKKRPDLLVFHDKTFVFRGENTPSNPITIFEFKRPGRDDFASLTSSENPINQITQYVSDILDGKYRTNNGLEINVGDHTPFFGYVICTATQKVKDWLKTQGFIGLPEDGGWFHHNPNLNLSVEVITWDRLQKDAEFRNKIFFDKLKL